MGEEKKADNITFQASDPEPSHLFAMGLEFVRIDIHEAALAEIERLRAEVQNLKDELLDQFIEMDLHTEMRG